MVSLTNNVLTTVSLPYKLKRTSGNPNRHRWPVTLIRAAAIQDVPCVVNTVGEKCNYLSRISPERVFSLSRFFQFNCRLFPFIFLYLPQLSLGLNPLCCILCRHNLLANCRNLISNFSEVSMFDKY